MRRAMLALLALPAFAAACGNQAGPAQPSLSAFAEGTCRVAAPDLLAIGRAGAQLGEDRTVDASVLQQLKDAQDGLRTVTDGAEPAYRTAFQDLVESTGFVRIRATGNGYEPALGRQLRADYAAVLKLCTVSS